FSGADVTVTNSTFAMNLAQGGAGGSGGAGGAGLGGGLEAAFGSILSVSGTTPTRNQALGGAGGGRGAGAARVWGRGPAAAPAPATAPRTTRPSPSRTARSATTWRLAATAGGEAPAATPRGAASISGAPWVA